MDKFDKFFYEKMGDYVKTSGILTAVLDKGLTRAYGIPKPSFDYDTYFEYPDPDTGKLVVWHVKGKHSSPEIKKIGPWEKFEKDVKGGKIKAEISTNLSPKEIDFFRKQLLRK